MRLQTILKPNPQICSVKELYFHEDDSFLYADGFFNLFYIEKRKKFTELEQLELCLRLKGWSKIALMHEQEMLQTEALEAEETKKYCFKLPYAETEKGVFWFKLEKAGDSERLLEGYYSGISPIYNPVHIAVDICTYRREAYVLRNMQSICAGLFTDDALEVRKHLQLMLIDNGNTLSSHKELQKLIEKEPRIRIYPNKNAGGAGGFTRGMLEAISQNERNDTAITHILLMDDDAVFDPDLFVRLYGLLAQLKPEHRKITVGGGLMREDFPYLQYACGERFQNFAVQNLYPLRDMREYSNCTSEYMLGTMLPAGTYGGWWCCCYSMETVRRDNLPIPLFIHHDDIEYGLRNQKNGIVFLNGISVWHRGFELTFTGANRYYDVRNSLISTALHDSKKGKWDALRYVWKSMTGTLISYRYAETELSCQGLLDFCKGPKWLRKQDPEALNNVLREKIKLEPYEALEMKIGEKAYQAALLEMDAYAECFSEQQIIDRCDKMKTSGRWKKKLTFNGWILPGKRHQDGRIKTISAIESPFKAYRERQVILFEPFNHKAMLAKRSYREFLRMMKLYGTAFHAAVCGYPRAAKEYRKELNEITSYESWKRYLDK